MSGTIATITELNIYPVKSCRGIALQSAQLTATGLAHDRQWMFVNAQGRFVTQRELPQLALVECALESEHLTLLAPGVAPLRLPLAPPDAEVEVTVWRDRCNALDEGDEAAKWISRVLAKEHRLVRFDPLCRRTSAPEWTAGAAALNQFSDGFPILVISQASLNDLNGRLTRPLPMNRFRPNIVVDGLDAYGEDRVHEFLGEQVCLRVVKPCTRCKITTTNQLTGEVEGDEPLRTLKGYRWSDDLMGVTFGQNVIIAAGQGRELRRGQILEITKRMV